MESVQVERSGRRLSVCLLRWYIKSCLPRHGGENEVTQYSLAVGRLGPRGACGLSLCPTVPFSLISRHDLVICDNGVWCQSLTVTREVVSAGLTRDACPARFLVCLADTS